MLQSVIFDIDKWNTITARKYLKSKGWEPVKNVHKTDKHLRYRIRNPEDFGYFYTINKKNGIKYIIGK